MDIDYALQHTRDRHRMQPSVGLASRRASAHATLASLASPEAAAFPRLADLSDTFPSLPLSLLQSALSAGLARKMSHNRQDAR